MIRARQYAGPQKNSIVNQFVELFKMDGVSLKFSDESIDKIVEETMDKGLGARGLRGTTEKVLEDFMFDITAKKKIVLNNENVNF